MLKSKNPTDQPGQEWQLAKNAYEKVVSKTVLSLQWTQHQENLMKFQLQSKLKNIFALWCHRSNHLCQLAWVIWLGRHTLFHGWSWITCVFFISSRILKLITCFLTIYFWIVMYPYKVEYLNPRNVLLDRFIFCFHNEDTLRFTYHPLKGPLYQFYGFMTSILGWIPRHFKILDFQG